MKRCVREQKGEDAYGSKLGRTGAKNRCKQDTRSIRKGIEEALACELYGLTDEEVAIVEGKE